jgi:hypothetical protein
MLYYSHNLAPAHLSGGFALGLMNDLERSLLEDVLDELDEQAPPKREGAIRRMREKMAAIKILQMVPQRRTPWWYSTEFWKTALIIVGIAAALLGVKIPAIPTP